MGAQLIEIFHRRDPQTGFKQVMKMRGGHVADYGQLRNVHFSP